MARLTAVRVYGQDRSTQDSVEPLLLLWEQQRFSAVAIRREERQQGFIAVARSDPCAGAGPARCAFRRPPPTHSRRMRGDITDTVCCHFGSDSERPALRWSRLRVSRGFPGMALSTAKPVWIRRCPATVMPPAGRTSPDAWPGSTICPRRKGGSFRSLRESQRTHFVLRG